MTRIEYFNTATIGVGPQPSADINITGNKFIVTMPDIIRYICKEWIEGDCLERQWLRGMNDDHKYYTPHLHWNQGKLEDEDSVCCVESSLDATRPHSGEVPTNRMYLCWTRPAAATNATLYMFAYDGDDRYH